MLSSLLSLANADGVITIDSGIPGPTIGIIAITHGNEPAGLNACDRLLHEFGLETHLLRGKVHLILNNIEASKQEKRFIDRDMNRLWDEEGVGYEYDRRDVITPYILECDHILDLHSTTAPSTPMAINARESEIGNALYGELRTEYLIHNFMEYILGTALISFHANHKPEGASIVLECGSHRDSTAGSIAYENSLRFLSYFSLVSYSYTPERGQDLEVISVYQAPGIGEVKYHYSPHPESFDMIAPSTLVAEFQGEQIYSPQEETCILMPTPFSGYVGDSVLYFTRRR